MLLTMVLFFSLFVSADGVIHIYDEDIWSLFDEEQQFCAINFNDGYQKMLLTVNTGKKLTGDKAVWIFPVPAQPEKTVINVQKGFPLFLGYDIEERASETISVVFSLMRLSQIYPIFSFFFLIGGGAESEEFSDEVTVHESMEKMGLSTELVSATDGTVLANYINSKGLDLQKATTSILDEYTGKEYSFVISWISDVDKFKREQGKTEGNGYREGWTGNAIGVYIAFPTEKIYYPLKPTSVYGFKKVPDVIYVLEYVTPELYKGIRTDTEIQYFFQNRLNVPEELEEFFSGYHTSNGQKKDIIVKDVKYTKIKVNPPAIYLTQDLWMEVSVRIPVKPDSYSGNKRTVN